MNNETTNFHTGQSVNLMTKQFASFIHKLFQWFEIKYDNFDFSKYKKEGSVIYAFNCSRPEMLKEVVEDSLQFLEKGRYRSGDKKEENREVGKIIILTEDEEVDNIRKIYDSNLFEVLPIKKLENIKFDTVFVFYPFRTYLNNKTLMETNPPPLVNGGFLEELAGEQLYSIYKTITHVKSNLALILSDKEWSFLTNGLNHKNTDFLKLQATKDGLERYVQNVGLTKLTKEEYIYILNDLYKTILDKVTESNDIKLFKQLFNCVIKAYNTGILNSELLNLTKEYEITNKIDNAHFEQIITDFGLDEKIILNAFWLTFKNEYTEAYGLWKELNLDEPADYILDILCQNGLILDVLIATNVNKLDEELKKINLPLTEKELVFLNEAQEILNKNLIDSSVRLLSQMLIKRLDEMNKTVGEKINNKMEVVGSAE